MTEQDPTSKKPSKAKKALIAGGAGVLAGSLVAGGASPAFAEPGTDEILDSAGRINHISTVELNPDEAALDAGRMELHPSAAEYEPGSFEYDPAATCHARDAEWLEAQGQPSAFIQFVYERAGIDPETASFEQKLDAFKDAMKDCYTKDPYIFASTLLMLDHSADGVAVKQEMINEYGDALINDPERWKTEFEGFMALFESPDNTCTIALAEAGKHKSLYTSDIDSEDGHSRIYMGGPSHITTEALIMQLPNGQGVAFKECLQPAWTTGGELEIPSGSIPHTLVDLPILAQEQCEPGFPIIAPIPPIAPVEFVGKPLVDHPLVADIPVAPIPDYAAMTGSGIDHSKGNVQKGYAQIARNHKQPTHLNNGNFSGNRKGRGMTIHTRTPNARRGNGR